MGKKDDVKAKMAMKPGAVSLAPEWSTSHVDDMQGFKTVKKGGGGGGNQQWKPTPQPVASVAHRPAEKKFVPQDYVVGATSVAKPSQQPKANKPKPLPKAKPAKQPQKTSWEEDDDDAGWATVGKQQGKQQQPAKPVQIKDSQKSDKQLKNEQNWQKKKAIKHHNAGVVGAAPLDPAEEKRRQQKEAKEAKKRMQELQKQQQAKQTATHADPAEDGFQTVTKSGAKAKKVKAIDSFGGQTAFSGLQKQQPLHKKLPKALKEREVKELTEEEQQEALRKYREKLTAKPADVAVEFKIEVQGTWYGIKNLLETRDFEHAPKLVAAACAQDKLNGGFFISADGKHWTNESTVDELWMSTSYLTGATKLLNTSESVSITPYWPPEKGGKDATTTLSISRPSLQEECYPTIVMTHTQKQATALQGISVSVHQFVGALVAEVERLEVFCEKIQAAADKLGETKRWQGKGKQQMLKDLLAKLPTKLDSLKTDLSYAMKEFGEKYPLPKEE